MDDILCDACGDLTRGLYSSTAQKKEEEEEVCGGIVVILSLDSTQSPKSKIKSTARTRTEIPAVAKKTKAETIKKRESGVRKRPNYH